MFTVYTKDYCPFCTKAKVLLDSLEIPYKEVDVTDDVDTLQKIMQISGMRTVPQIFASETECLGGYDDIAKLHNEGKLLEKAGK
ncbi:glutaredoxin [Candidatus Gracilibacteria bacterium]|nr:MAG: glutaredoxin [Candidatus Gracilibacteria bacterium]